MKEKSNNLVCIVIILRVIVIPKRPSEEDREQDKSRSTIIIDAKEFGK